MLAGEHRDLVRKLSAILRLADGLDRTHDARVRDLSVRSGRGGIVVTVHSAKDLDLELWAVRQKAALFREAFGVEPAFTSGKAAKTRS